jgi:hypothetical protein
LHMQQQLLEGQERPVMASGEGPAGVDSVIE